MRRKWKRGESVAAEPLVKEIYIDAPPQVVFSFLTDPIKMIRWMGIHAELDPRPGGIYRLDPNRRDVIRGTYLEVVPNEKLVFTDAFTGAWEPSAKPFMTGILTFEDAGPGKTKYTARVRHWTVADREAHEKMGFHQGWGICADQLTALVTQR